MDTSGPTPIAATPAGTPLTNSAIDSRKNTRQTRVAEKNESAIRDTVETSDREADGRLPVRQSPPADAGAGAEQDDRLDLCG